jgi:tetratricopeptide (TPR) repeat protein
VARQDRPEADAGGDASVEPWAVPRERSAAFGDSTATAAADTGAPEGPPPGAWSPWPPPIGPPPAAVGPPPPPEEPKETDEVAIARLRVAELYLLRLKRPLDALEYYDSVIEHHPESPLAWKAAYAIAWIKENETDDPDGALEAYREVVRRYPGTKQAAEAERAVARLGGAPVSPAPSADGAEGEAWDGGRSAWPPSD